MENGQPGDIPFEKTSVEHDGLRFSALALGEGPVVLCLHGFPDHNRSFRHQLPALAAAGYRAVAPMLRGYEPSAQAQPFRIVDHHPLRIAADVCSLAAVLGESEPVHLIGHDWGGIATYLACSLEPERFRSATAIAVPALHALEEGIRRHPIQLRNSWYTLFFQLRGLADSAVSARDFAFIEKLWRDWSPGWQWPADEMASLKDTFRRPGVLRSALAYYRAMLNPFLAESRRTRRLAEKPCEVPMLAVTGARDGCMDTRIFDCIRPELFPAGFRIERLVGVGHFAHQEDPETANDLLLGWLDEHR